MIGFLGDTHGKFQTMIKTIAENPLITEWYHVGDAGLINSPELTDKENKKASQQIINSMYISNVFFNRGNHDNPLICQNSQNFIHDNTIVNTSVGKMWVCGGARSTDAHKRIPGIDWVHDEELSLEQWTEVINKRKFMNTSLIMTHDCPQSIFNMIPSSCPVRRSEISETRNHLELILNTILNEGNGDDVDWYFGHHHNAFEFQVANIKFHCVPQDSMIIHSLRCS